MQLGRLQRPAGCTSPSSPPRLACAGDQLFRNAFRGTAKMYAADDKVLAWAKTLLVRSAVGVPAAAWLH